MFHKPLEHDVKSAVRPLARSGAQAMQSSPWAMLIHPSTERGHGQVWARSEMT